MSSPFIHFTVNALDDEENVLTGVIASNATVREALDKVRFSYGSSNTFSVNNIPAQLDDQLRVNEEGGMTFIIVGEKTDNG